MPRSSSTLSDNLSKRLRALELSRVKIESLINTSLLSQHVSLHMYEGLFLNAHVAFEGFIEELFIGLLVENQGLESSRSDIVPRVKFKSHRIARELLTGPGRQYIDWLPYDRTLDRANMFFRGGRPFSELQTHQKDHLLKCHTIRNAIAHRSRFSLKKFEQHVLVNTPLPPRERSPAGYLRGFFRTAPVQTRFEVYVAQLLQIAIDLGR